MKQKICLSITPGFCLEAFTRSLWSPWAAETEIKFREAETTGICGAEHQLGGSKAELELQKSA